MTTAIEINRAGLLQAGDQGRALPSSWYTDETIYQREIESVLRPAWHFGTHIGDLTKPGDVVLRDVAGLPIIFTRDGDGKIRGFVNVCRHRAHPVVLESGNRKRETLQCLYHGWTYGFDGSLVRAPRAEYEEDCFDAAECSLLPVQIHVWGPTVWVNPDGSAPSFQEWAPGLQEQVEAHGVHVSAYRFAFQREFRIKANWKVFLDNAIECYHCPTCHTQLSSILVMNPHRQKTTIRGTNWSTHEMEFKNEDRRYYFHWIFPTTYFQYAGRGFDIGAVDIRGIDEIVFTSLTFLPHETDPAEIEALEKRLDENPTIREDVDICERVQKSHATGMAPPGRLLAKSEELVLHYQRTLIEMLSGSS